MMPKPEYERLISVDAIPPMPETAAKLLVMAIDPDVEVKALADVIERDPALNARLLGVANSVFYSPQPPVINMREAIIRVLGLGMVRNMAFGMALSGGLSSADCERFDLTGYWLTALGTADLSCGLARASNDAGIVTPDMAYLTGLLHNIGELLLVHLWPEGMDEVLRRSVEETSLRLEEHQRAVLGLDQWEAGAFLCRHWELPPEVAEAILALGRSPADLPQEPVVRLLSASRRWLLGLMAGRSDVLRVEGVDETYCEYRTGAFSERFEDLRKLAQNMA